jgi:hypothetical protein
VKVEDADSAEITREHVRLIEGNPSTRVAIFAAFNDEYKALADIARPNWLAYAERHNYALRFYPHGFHLDPSHPKSYGDKNRFHWYYDLRGHCDIVVYLDVDSLFMSMDVRVEDQLGEPIPTTNDPRFAWTYDENGPGSGLWIARTDKVTEKHLRYAYTLAAQENNVRHDVIEPNGISDQDAMTRLMNIPPFRDTFGYCYNAKAFGHCSAQTWERGDWIVHFGGLNLREKIAGMENYRELAR